MGALRASAVLTGFAVLTVPLMPVQALLIRVSPNAARRFPHWYHRQVCRLMGITLTIEGEVESGRPVLLVCNHTTWLDVPVLSALAPVSFVSKKEIGTWPFVSTLARLQRTVFIDRSKRQSAGDAAGEISNRLASGDTIVLFAEGTTSDGNRVLPFLSSLFAAVKSNGSASGPVESSDQIHAVVQTAAVVYTHLHGIPLARADRPRVGWYGDMEMQSHAWGLLKSGPLKVTIKVSPPVPLESFAGRKELALITERTIRRAVLAILRGRPDGNTVVPVEPDANRRKIRPLIAPASNEKWT
jgi:lyso-ornithine lipid O-acyltransferase